MRKYKTVELEEKIKFKDLSGNLKFAIISGYIYGISFIIGFIYGIMIVLGLTL